jgi:adenylate cyclase
MELWMGQEIERKYLLQGEGWRPLSEGVFYAQGYLTTAPECTVRVRIVGDRGYLTIKGKTVGCSRSEYEYLIPYSEATEMLDQLCSQRRIEKKRYTIPFAGLRWEVDEFGGSNQGLILAEVELTAADQEIIFPDWIGREVTADPWYYNSNLALHPFTVWHS